MERDNLAHPRHCAIHSNVAVVLVPCTSSLLVLGEKCLNTGDPLTKGAIPVPVLVSGKRAPQHRLVYISELRCLYRPSVRPQVLHFMGRVGPGEPSLADAGDMCPLPCKQIVTAIHSPIGIKSGILGVDFRRG